MYWGAGHICNKAFEVSGIKPDLIIDNNINLTGVSQLDCLVKHPSEVIISKISNCITSTSISDIFNQALSLGVERESIYCASCLEQEAVINEFESREFDYLFTSGLAYTSEPESLSGGGLYRLTGSFDHFSLKKIHNVSCHGIFSHDNKIICLSESGIIIYNNDLDHLKTSPLPIGTRAHGIAFCELTERYVVVSTYHDSLIYLDKIVTSLAVAKYQISPADLVVNLNHCNDVTVKMESPMSQVFRYW